MQNDKVTIELSNSEALVFFEFLARFSRDAKLEITDQSEERILWNICSSLEEGLTELFDDNYDDLLAKAREKVRDKDIC